MLEGLFVLPWWGYLLVTLLLTHLTIVSVTVFLHRAQAHRALTLHPVVSHLFRFWLWLTTGMVTKEWVAVHRKHHAHCDAEEDPHSPQMSGLTAVLWRGAELYRTASADEQLVQRYGQGTPDDWIERQLYSRYTLAGLGLMLMIDLLCFGAIGLTIWAVQMLWIPFWAAGVINGLGHWCGYRNFETADASRNLFPLAILVGGEELHNNHHAFPSSARLSSRWFELDIGWCYIRLLAGLRLARVTRVAPGGPQGAGANLLQVLGLYGQQVVLPLLREERRRQGRAGRRLLARARWLLLRERSTMNALQSDWLERSLSLSEALATVYEFQNRLRALWPLRSRSAERWREALLRWCQDARQSGIRVLAEFADSLIRTQSLAVISR